MLVDLLRSGTGSFVCVDADSLIGSVGALFEDSLGDAGTGSISGSLAGSLSRGRGSRSEGGECGCGICTGSSSIVGSMCDL
jgi:hypothetical protein